MSHVVLLAEDNDDHALITCEALCESHGPDVSIQHVHDGAAALSFLLDPDEPLPNLILLDIQMPRLNGLRALEEIKSHEILRVVPVVMLTSSDDDRDIAVSLGLGSNSYVTKPVDADDLREVLSQIPSYWFRTETPLEVTSK